MNRSKRIFSIIAIIFILILAGCRKNTDVPSSGAYINDGMYDYGRTYDEFAYEEDVLFDGESAVSEAAYPKAVPSDNGAESTTQQRMIQKSASINIQVMDPLSAADEIITMTEQMGGFVISSSSTQELFSGDIYLPRADLSIRVPADRLLEMLGFIEGRTTDAEKYVSNKRVYGVDITSDYVDTNSRLTSLEKTRDKLYEILDTAENATEALEIYSSISDVESEIEVQKGRIKYMEESVALSSIDIRISSVKPAPIRTVKGWSLGEVIKDAFGTLLDAGKSLLEILVYILIVVLPILILIAIPIVVIILLIKKGRKSGRKGTKTGTDIKQDDEDILAEVKKK